MLGGSGQAFEQLIDKFKGFYLRYFNVVKSRLLGANNEKLDFLMDSFYKMNPQEKMRVFLIGGVTIVILVIGVFYLYFSSLNKLETDLNYSFDSLHRLYTLKNSYKKEEANYTALVRAVSSSTSDFRVKPFFEDQAQKLNVEIQDIREQKVPIPDSDPLSKQLDYVRVDTRISRISIPKLISLITEVERSGKFLMVDKLKISELYQDKLYFAVDIRFRGYSIIGQNI